jgi:hypothetical protein
MEVFTELSLQLHLIGTELLSTDHGARKMVSV